MPARSSACWSHAFPRVHRSRRSRSRRARCTGPPGPPSETGRMPRADRPGADAHRPARSTPSNSSAQPPPTPPHPSPRRPPCSAQSERAQAPRVPPHCPHSSPATRGREPPLGRNPPCSVPSQPGWARSSLPSKTSSPARLESQASSFQQPQPEPQPGLARELQRRWPPIRPTQTNRYTSPPATTGPSPPFSPLKVRWRNHIFSAFICNLFSITAMASALWSTMQKARPFFAAASPVVPLPAKKSSTRSPGLE